jgi:predicted metal-dependent hydrolase
MPDEPENLVLRPRDVRFDWSALPAHWIPGEPFATHVFNVMHLLLPEGERWFVAVFKEALPLITDERLREEVVGLLPTLSQLVRSALRYFKRGYHPSQDGSTSQAVAYLASSPAALAAGH